MSGRAIASPCPRSRNNRVHSRRRSRRSARTSSTTDRRWEIRNNSAVLCCKWSRYFSWLRLIRSSFLSLSRRLAAGELEEDLFQASCGRTKFIEIPAGSDHGTRQVSAHQLSLLALHFKDQALLFTLGTRYAADSGDSFKLLLHQHGFRLAIARGHLEQKRFGAARLRLQVAHRIGCHQLALVDDDDLLAGLFDLRKDMSAEDNGVIPGQALDQVAGFIDLLGIEPRRWFVKNQHVRVVNDGLRQPHSLAIAFGEFAQKLGLDIRHKAAVADIIVSLLQIRS